MMYAQVFKGSVQMSDFEMNQKNKMNRRTGA